MYACLIPRGDLVQSNHLLCGSAYPHVQRPLHTAFRSRGRAQWPCPGGLHMGLCAGPMPKSFAQVALLWALSRGASPVPFAGAGSTTMQATIWDKAPIKLPLTFELYARCINFSSETNCQFLFKENFKMTLLASMRVCSRTAPG